VPPPPPGGAYMPPAPPPAGYVPPPPGAYMAPGMGYAGQRTDGLAIASLIIGIVSVACFVVCLGIVLGPIAAILGFISRQRVATSGGMVKGGTMATIGMVLGVIGFVVSVIWLFVALSGALNSPTPTPTP
jgi:hypothetical protein